jgi:leucyl-tRNA synthetase
MGRQGRLFEHPWPVYDEQWAVSASATVAVQVGGKLRATIEVPKDAPQTLVEEKALQDANVRRFLEGVSIRKVIYVPNKIINFIVAPG